MWIQKSRFYIQRWYFSLFWRMNQDFIWNSKIRHPNSSLCFYIYQSNIQDAFQGSSFFVKAGHLKSKNREIAIWKWKGIKSDPGILISMDIYFTILPKRVLDENLLFAGGFAMKCSLWYQTEARHLRLSFKEAGFVMPIYIFLKANSESRAFYLKNVIL